MQHERFKPHALERTFNPVQRPSIRGRTTKGTPKDYQSRGLESPARQDRIERNPKVAVLPPIGEVHQLIEEWVGEAQGLASPSPGRASPPPRPCVTLPRGNTSVMNAYTSGLLHVEIQTGARCSHTSTDQHMHSKSL